MDVMQAIKIRRSVREYRPDPLPEEVFSRLKDSLRFAPSACNNQPWKFIFVTDPELKKALAHAARDQKFIAEAPGPRFLLARILPTAPSAFKRDLDMAACRVRFKQGLAAG